MELYHHGIKGQRWGFRRFQNENGSLTSRGRQRYSSDSENSINSKNSLSNKKLEKHKNKLSAEYNKQMVRVKSGYNKNKKDADELRRDYEDLKKNGKNSAYAKKHYDAEDYGGDFGSFQRYHLNSLDEAYSGSAHDAAQYKYRMDNLSKLNLNDLKTKKLDVIRAGEAYALNSEMYSLKLNKILK